MPSPYSDPSITQILVKLNQGDEKAIDDLFPLVYDELHKLARRHMKEQRPDHTLQPSALVNEAYLKLFKTGGTQWKNRNHFLAFASRAMRSVLVDHARTKNRAKRKPSGERIALNELNESYEEPAIDLLALDEALVRLSKVDEDLVRLVELRFFGGLSTKEIAEVLELSPRKVEREWRTAKAWLKKELE